MKFVSYAQNDEDVLLWRALKPVTRGFYIDVGAAIIDGYSVSRAFYEHGWRGVNIEPVPDLCEAVQAARPEDVTLCVALGATTGDHDFFTVAGTGLSTLDPAIAEEHRMAGRSVTLGSVPMRTLAEVCRAHAEGPIHYLKIDVEGAEGEVLAGADLTSFRPWIIVLEATRPARPEPSHAEWEPDLVACGYRFVWFDGLNRFYVATEHEAALGPQFGVPPNVWDAFIRFDPARAACEKRLIATEAQLVGFRDALTEKVEQLAAESEATATAAAEALRLRRALAAEVEARMALARRLASLETGAQPLGQPLGFAEADAQESAVPGLQMKATAQPLGHSFAQPVTRRLAKRLLRQLWQLAWPIIRPIAWRARSFLVGPAQQELALFRADYQRELAELRAGQQRLGKISAAQEQNAAAMVAELAQMGRPMQAAMLTIAVTRGSPLSNQGS